MCQLRKSFQQGSPEALPQPSLCAGDGRLGRDLPPSPPTIPCSLPGRDPAAAAAPWHLGFAEGVSLLGSGAVHGFDTSWLCRYPHGSADIPPGSQAAPPALPGSSTGTGLTHWDNLAQPVITSVLIPFVTTGSVQRPLLFPASPPIASLHELHFDL